MNKSEELLLFSQIVYAERGSICQVPSQPCVNLPLHWKLYTIILTAVILQRSSLVLTQPPPNVPHHHLYCPKLTSRGTTMAIAKAQPSSVSDTEWWWLRALQLDSILWLSYVYKCILISKERNLWRSPLPAVQNKQCLLLVNKGENMLSWEVVNQQLSGNWLHICPNKPLKTW